MELPEALMALRAWAKRAAETLDAKIREEQDDAEESAKRYCFGYAVAQVNTHATDVLCSLESLTASLEALSAIAALITNGRGIPWGVECPPCYIAVENREIRIAELDPIDANGEPATARTGPSGERKDN